MTRNWKRPPRKSRKWCRPPRRIPLRQDNTPAAPVVVRLFNDIQMVRSQQQQVDVGEIECNVSDEVRAGFEREAWVYLIEYLMTLEAPDFLYEPG
jgi:hypothetical protein